MFHQFGSTGSSKRLVKTPKFGVDTVRVSSPLICTLLLMREFRIQTKDRTKLLLTCKDLRNHNRDAG